MIAATASRYEFAQTVCTPGFYDALPPMASAVRGLFLADTSHYYPEDRSISESMRSARASRKGEPGRSSRIMTQKTRDVSSADQPACNPAFRSPSTSTARCCRSDLLHESTLEAAGRAPQHLFSLPRWL